MEGLAHFHLLRPEWLLLGLPLLVIEWARDSATEDQHGLGHAIAPHLLRHLLLPKPKPVGLTPNRAFRAILLCMLIMLAGPAWRQQPSPLAEDASPLVFVVDISASMDEADVPPSRLTRVRQKIADLLARVPDKQVALVAFAGSAHTVLALSADHDIIDNYLSALSTRLAPRPGKFSEYALPNVDRLLARSNRVASVVLMTDGLGSQSRPLWRAWCGRQPHKLLVYAIGSDDPRQTDLPVQTQALEDLAADCNGAFVEDTVDLSDIDHLAAQLTEGYQIIDDDALPWVDSAYWLIFPTLFLMLLWFRPGWSRAWLFIPFLVLPQPKLEAQVARDRELFDKVDTLNVTQTGHNGFEWSIDGFADSFAGLWLSADQYGWLLFQLGDYERASRIFEDPMWQATAAYYQQDFDRAAALFTRKDSIEARFNRANAQAHHRDYLPALESYQQVLAEQPDFPGAAANSARIQALVDEMERMSAKQVSEEGVSTSTLTENDPQAAQGADVAEAATEARPQYSAEAILADPVTAELWLKAVQPDPSQFLRTKFSIQWQERGVSEP